MLLKGEFHPDFGQVAETLIGILPREGRAGGAALTIYHQGEKVADVWGGTKDRDMTPWEQDTLALSFSTTKGVASTLLHILVDRGMADYEDPIARYWPEFSKHGKNNITIKQAMCHEAGLYNIIDHIDTFEELLDWDLVLQRIADAKPRHEPGIANGYHAINYGHLVGGIIEKITQAPFQEMLEKELVKPLALDGMYIGLPDHERDRCAKLITANGAVAKNANIIDSIPRPLQMALYHLAKSLGFDAKEIEAGLIPPAIRGANFNDDMVARAIAPAFNGMFTARSLARMYAMIANGGELDGVRILSPERVQIMGKVQNRRRDKVLGFPMNWRLGYHQAFTGSKIVRRAFGHYGFGGSGAWCCTDNNLAVALTLNNGVGTPTGDLRIIRLSRAIAQCAERRLRLGSHTSIESDIVLPASAQGQHH